MEDYKERIVVEQSELKEKIHKLDYFILTDLYRSLESVQRELVITQLKTMKTYLLILGERLK